MDKNNVPDGYYYNALTNRVISKNGAKYKQLCNQGLISAQSVHDTRNTPMPESMADCPPPPAGYTYYIRKDKEIGLRKLPERYTHDNVMRKAAIAQLKFNRQEITEEAIDEMADRISEVMLEEGSHQPRGSIKRVQIAEQPRAAAAAAIKPPTNNRAQPRRFARAATESEYTSTSAAEFQTDEYSSEEYSDEEIQHANKSISQKPSIEECQNSFPERRIVQPIQRQPRKTPSFNGRGARR